jgi:hypothetical protein
MSTQHDMGVPLHGGMGFKGGVAMHGSFLSGGEDAPEYANARLGTKAGNHGTHSCSVGLGVAVHIAIWKKR